MYSHTDDDEEEDEGFDGPIFDVKVVNCCNRLYPNNTTAPYTAGQLEIVCQRIGFRQIELSTIGEIVLQHIATQCTALL